MDIWTKQELNLWPSFSFVSCFKLQAFPLWFTFFCVVGLSEFTCNRLIDLTQSRSKQKIDKLNWSHSDNRFHSPAIPLKASVESFVKPSAFVNDVVLLGESLTQNVTQLLSCVPKQIQFCTLNNHNFFSLRNRKQTSQTPFISVKWKNF